MPQLVPFYFVKQAAFAIAFIALLYVFYKYILPRFVRLFSTRVFISKFKLLLYNRVISCTFYKVNYFNKYCFSLMNIFFKNRIYMLYSHLLVFIFFKFFFLLSLNMLSFTYILPILSSISACMVYAMHKFINSSNVGKEIFSMFLISLALSYIIFFFRLYYLMDFIITLFIILQLVGLDVSNWGIKYNTRLSILEASPLKRGKNSGPKSIIEEVGDDSIAISECCTKLERINRELDDTTRELAESKQDNGIHISKHPDGYFQVRIANQEEVHITHMIVRTLIQNFYRYKADFASEVNEANNIKDRLLSKRIVESKPTIVQILEAKIQTHNNISRSFERLVEDN